MSTEETDFERLDGVIVEHLEKIEIERERFEELMGGRDPSRGPFDWRHTENVANRLLKFYTGIERIFERIAKDLDTERPDGKRWHKSLLRQMATPTDQRPAVVDNELRRSLMEYLAFRHVYREGYVVDLEWGKMVGLVEDFEDVAERTVEVIQEFREEMKS